jgi:WD40 repeat protein
LRTLGDYAIEGELGRGGMGVVYRGRSPQGRVVAVKLLLAAQSRESVDRFQRETRLLGSLGEAQGFVPLLDSGSSPQGPFLVMPFLPGGTLRDRLARGPLDVATVSSIALALARALGAAHAQGIVHRDLKPENVLFTEEGREGRPLLADLGLAKHFARDSALSISLSKTGELRGTVGYMAPEQMNDTKNVGPACDVFALGAIVYECLAGTPPFLADTPHATLALTAAGKFVPLRKHRPDVPARLAQTIERALAPDSTRRFSDGAAFANALQAAASAPSGRPRPGMLALALLVPALLLALALVLGGVVTAPGREPAAVAAPPPPPVRPVAPNPPPRAFPRACDGFLASKHMKLASILGSYQGRHGDTVTGVAFSPDGQLVASVALDRVRTLWTLEGDEALRLAPAAAKLTSVAFTPNGNVLLTGGEDGTVEACSTETGEVLRTFKSDSEPVLGITSTEDGRWAVAAGSRGSVRFWDLESGEARHVARLKGSLRASALRPGTTDVLLALDSSLVLVADIDKDAPRVARTFKSTGATLALAISRDGARAVSGDANGSLSVWDLGRDEPVRTIAAHPGSNVLSVALSRDGSLAASGASDGSAHVIDLERGEVVATLEGHSGAVRGIAVAADGRHVATGDDGRARLFAIGAGAPKKLWRDGGRRGTISALALAPRGLLLAGTVGNGTCMIWDLERGTELGPLAGPGQGNVNGIAVSPDGRRVLTVAHDRSARFFDLETRSLVWRVGGFGNNVLGVAFSSDGKLAIVGSDDPLVRVLEVEQGREVARMVDAGMGWIVSVGFFPGDADHAFATGHDGVLRIWDVPRREVVSRIGGHPGTARAVPVPGSLRALLSNSDGTVGICDLAAGAEIARFVAHAKTEPRIAAFPDGRHAVTASQDDATLKIWDLGTRSLVDQLAFSSAHDSVMALAVAPDGKTLYAGTQRGVVLVFDVKLPDQ